MPLHQLHGVDVDFPYDPYPCQVRGWAVIMALCGPLSIAERSMQAPCCEANVVAPASCLA